VACVEQSLARMKIDHLDVVQVPRFAIPTDLEQEGALDALFELKEKGKVRFIGISGTLPHLMEFILRFTNPDLDTTIVGTIDPPHLRTNLDILQEGPLPPDLYEEAKHRLTPTGSAPQASGNIC
jgi:aryl-alcohol dehydrogenase-like predicted oxidoreductase